MFEQMVYDIKSDVVKLLMHVTKRDEGTSRKESARITDAKLASAKDAIDLVDGKNAIKGDKKDVKINKTVVNDKPKIGRNDPCWCGSGKKYKNCHGKNA